MNNWGIRGRVLFLALAPCAAILFTLLIYFTYVRIADVDAALARQGIAIARQLASAAEFALFAGDRVTLQKLADAAAREANVSTVHIRDTAGHELALGTAEHATTDATKLVAFTHPVVETRLAADIPERLHVPEQAALGEIVVDMSREAAEAEQRRLLAIGLALGLGCMIAAVLLAMAIGNGVVQPIRRLARAMREVGAGVPVPPLDVTGGGELRALNEGFNDMVAKLSAGTEELQARIAAATRELSAQRDTAEEATAAKSRFIAAASHDLRQPLHAIGMFTSTLERRAARTDLAPVVAELAQAVGVMDRLFEALLESEHLEAAAQKDVSLRFRPTPLVVVSDELLLHRLLGNLVANAIRYTREGSVLVAARRRGSEVLLEVRDSGIGISQEHQEAIFGEFYQVGNPARDRRLGLGLGLAIVARIARLLGTDVHVRSAPGKGSTFSLRQPLALDDGAATLARRLPVTSVDHGMAGLAALIVDDDPIALAGSRALLEELGCRVHAAADAPAAEAAMDALRGVPVVVLCDLWLSDEHSGIGLLQRLRRMARAPFCAVLVSGDTRPETIQLANDAGFLLLHKPVAPARVRGIVQQFNERCRLLATETPS